MNDFSQSEIDLLFEMVIRTTLPYSSDQDSLVNKLFRYTSYGKK